MLEYAYYENLSCLDKILYQKCHTLQNDVFQILKKNFVNVYSIFHIWQSVIKTISVRELHMIRNSIIPVALNLDRDFHTNTERERERETERER